MTEMRALLTPGADGAWHLHLRPVPMLQMISGLDRDGECLGLSAPDYCAWNRPTVAHRAGYTRRLHASGPSSDQAHKALRTLLAELIQERE